MTPTTGNSMHQSGLPRIIAGAMSGTSADGVDVALVQITGCGATMTANVVHHHAHAYSPVLRQQIFSARAAGTVSWRDMARLTHDLSQTYADAINIALESAGLKATDIAAVAAHGQTMFHDPPLTIQLFDPSLVAARVGCAVVSDFRRADCAAGGQGAPLVPFADYVLFRSETSDRVLLNVGGIANLTYLRTAGAPAEVKAFDTGPGNCISDHICRTHLPNGPGYDENGSLAARGSADLSVVESFCADAYFKQPPPKSTDIPKMIARFGSLAHNLSIEGALATACAISVQSIVEAFARFVGDPQKCEWIISGGGAENATLMKMLQQRLPRLVRIEALGVHVAAKEAVAFALLGAATLDGQPSNMPSVTGAVRRVVLGSITPRP